MRLGPTAFDRLGGKFTKIARVFSREYGVTVNLRGVGCNTDGVNVINIPANADYLEEADQQILEGMLDHEWSHVWEERQARRRQEEWDKTKEGARPQTPIECMGSFGDKRESLMFNVFEDVRIEREARKKYPGVCENLRELHKFTSDNFLTQPERWTCGGDFWKTIASCIVFRCYGDESFAKWAPEPLVRILDDVVSDEVDAAHRTSVPEECVDLALRVVRKISERKEELEKEVAARRGGKKRHEGRGGLSGMSDEEISEELELLEKEGDEEGVPSSLVEEVKEEISRSAKEEARASGRYIPLPEAMDLDYVFTPEMGSETAYAQRRAEVAPQVAALRAKISTVLRTRTQRRHIGDQESGSLDPSALYSLRTGNKRVFTETIPEQDLDTAVQVLVDLSGSMASQVSFVDYRTRVHFAQMTCIALGETLNLLSVPFEIWGWDNDRLPSGSHIDGVHSRFMGFRYWRFKEYGERWRSVRRRLLGMKAGRQNVDGEAVMMAAMRLARRQEKRKILFVFSDGEPAGGCEHGHNLQNLSDVVKRVTSSGIEVVGLGVQSHSVNRFYSKQVGAESVVFDDLKGLAPGVFRVLGRKMLRRAS